MCHNRSPTVNNRDKTGSLKDFLKFQILQKDVTLAD